MNWQNGFLQVFENDVSNSHDFDRFVEWGGYWVHSTTLDNRIVYTTSGSLKLNPEPGDGLSPPDAAAVAQHFTGTSQDWRDAWLRFYVSLPTDLYNPDTQTFHVEQMAPFVCLNGFQKGGDNHYGGWSIWNFGTEPLRLGQKRTRRPDGRPEPNEQMAIWAHMSVKGREFQIVRASYSLTIAGRVIAR